MVVSEGFLVGVFLFILCFCCELFFNIIIEILVIDDVVDVYCGDVDFVFNIFCLFDILF